MQLIVGQRIRLLRANSATDFVVLSWLFVRLSVGVPGAAVAWLTLSDPLCPENRRFTMAMPPHWLDDVIEKSLQTGNRDPPSLGWAISGCERMQEAIRVGLAESVPGRLGLSQAQLIRQAIMEAMEAGGA